MDLRDNRRQHASYHLLRICVLSRPCYLPYLDRYLIFWIASAELQCPQQWTHPSIAFFPLTRDPLVPSLCVRASWQPRHRVNAIILRSWKFVDEVSKRSRHKAPSKSMLILFIGIVALAQTATRFVRTLTFSLSGLVYYLYSQRLWLRGTRLASNFFLI